MRDAGSRRTVPDASILSEIEAHPALRFLGRHYIELLTALVLLFVLQTGFVPFDYDTPPAPGEASSSFGALVNHRTLPDIVSNIFLYLPVGALLYLSLSHRGWHRVLVWPMAVILSAGLSFFVEWIQSYSSIRVSSLIDFVSNLIGASLGAALAWMAGYILPRLLNVATAEWILRPQTALLKAYVVGLVVFAAMPFSLSFDRARLSQAVKSVVLTPFGTTPQDAAFRQEALRRHDATALAMAQWREMKRWARWAAECCSFAVLAWLLHAFLRGDYRFSRRSTSMLIWWLGVPLAIGLSLLQLPIVTRPCDVTDALFRCAGLWLGLATRAAYLRDREHLTVGLQDRREQGLMRWGSRALIVYIIYTGVIPLTFDAGVSGPSQSLASTGFLPFFSYFMARFDLMMGDVMEKFFCYALLAMLLAASWKRVENVAPMSRLMTISVAGLLLCAGIEIVQMFIPVRVTSLTDPILACGGCVVGVVGHRWGAIVLQAGARRRADLAREQERVLWPPERMAPTDELVATLTQPHPDAPVEETPKAPAEKPQNQP